MKFRDILGNFQSQLKKASVERRTQRAVHAYRNSGDVKYTPRLYGYHQTPNGMEVVEDEAKVIRIVLGLLAIGTAVDEVKKNLDKRNIRNRSGNLLTKKEIIEMPKPIFAGMVKTESSGRWVKSAHYEPIVSVEILRKAQKTIRKVSEGADYRPPAIGERVFLTLAEDRRCPDTWQSILNGFSRSSMASNSASNSRLSLSERGE